ncbi:RteC domain-containing protein [Flagellimonas sp. 389]|uniref:RteC domain-containing protein n=1 Tax=Flagellimonas sp. 389 TaxID=2835862 RepID=UPI003530323D
MLFNIEKKRPRSSRKTQVKYLNKHIDKLQIYFHDNLEFYHFYRITVRNFNSLDKHYLSPNFRSLTSSKNSASGKGIS